MTLNKVCIYTYKNTYSHVDTHTHFFYFGSEDSIVGTVTRHEVGRLRNQRSIPAGEEEIFLFSRMSKLTLGPTQSPTL